MFNWLFKVQKSNADIIDPIEFEVECLEMRSSGFPVLPPPPIPSIEGSQYTEEEMNEMRSNRSQLEIIYNRVRVLSPKEAMERIIRL